MVLRKRALILTVAGILAITGFFGCSKQTNTASQGIDVVPKQAETVAPPQETAPPVSQSTIRETPVREAINEKVALQDVYFDLDRAKITPEMKNIIDKDAEILKANKQMKVKIEGHCDERGTDEYNLALGNQRAHTVQKVLVAEGVSGARLSTISYGKQKPFCNEQNEACYQQNRRAHFSFQ